MNTRIFNERITDFLITVAATNKVKELLAQAQIIVAATESKSNAAFDALTDEDKKILQDFKP